MANQYVLLNATAVPNADWNITDTTNKGCILNKPTTLSGYGITDANISNGVITLGNNTITPVTSTGTTQNLSVTTLTETIQNVTSTSSTTLNASSGTIIKLTLSTNITSLTLTANAGTTLTVIITNGGSYNITWPTIYWASGTAPTLTDSGIDIATLFYDGTNWYGTVLTGLATA